MIDKAIDLTMRHWSEEPLSWSNNDCLMALADYIELLTGVDVATRWRGTYSDLKGAMVIVDSFGGTKAFINHVLVGSAFSAKNTAERGDIVLVNSCGRDLGGIFLDPLTALRRQGRGRVLGRFQHVAIWGMKCAASS